MEYFGKTDIGKVRKENQDDFAIREDSERRLVAAVVCDGMGGAAGGNITSALAVKVISDKITSCYNEKMRDGSIKNLPAYIAKKNPRLKRG